MDNDEYAKIERLWESLAYGHPARRLYKRIGPLTYESRAASMKKALIDGGIWPIEWTEDHPMDGSAEYEEILAAQEIMNG